MLDSRAMLSQVGKCRWTHFLGGINKPSVLRITCAEPQSSVRRRMCCGDGDAVRGAGVMDLGSRVVRD